MLEQGCVMDLSHLHVVACLGAVRGEGMEVGVAWAVRVACRSCSAGRAGGGWQDELCEVGGVPCVELRHHSCDLAVYQAVGHSGRSLSIWCSWALLPTDITLRLDGLICWLVCMLVHACCGVCGAAVCCLCCWLQDGVCLAVLCQ